MISRHPVSSLLRQNTDTFVKTTWIDPHSFPAICQKDRDCPFFQPAALPLSGLLSIERSRDAHGTPNSGGREPGHCLLTLPLVLCAAPTTGGLLIFQGKECIYSHYDESTGAHASLEDVLSAALRGK